MDIYEYIKKTKNYNLLKDNLTKKSTNTALSGLIRSCAANLIYALLEDSGNKGIYIAGNSLNAAKIAEDLRFFSIKNGEDIHKQAASKVLGIPLEEVTKQQRSHAKAVNFGIVYGISDFGLAGQLGISKKEAKQYIESYLEKYSGIKKFMEDIVEKAKQQGSIYLWPGSKRFFCCNGQDEYVYPRNPGCKNCLGRHSGKSAFPGFRW